MTGSPAVLEVTNPATSEAIASVPGATAEEDDRAVEIATRHSRMWARTLVHERVAALRRSLATLQESRDELNRLLIQEGLEDGLRAFTQCKSVILGNVLVKPIEDPA